MTRASPRNVEPYPAAFRLAMSYSCVPLEPVYSNDSTEFFMHLVVNRARPELDVSGGNVLLHRAQARVGEAGSTRQHVRIAAAGAAGTCQRTQVVGVDGQVARRYVRPVDHADDGVVRRVLDDVEGHVAEVAFVADAVAAAEDSWCRFRRRHRQSRRAAPSCSCPAPTVRPPDSGWRSARCHCAPGRTVSAPDPR